MPKKVNNIGKLRKFVYLRLCGCCLEGDRLFLTFRKPFEILGKLLGSYYHIA